MGINNPVPRSLAKESRKAAKILASFIKPNQVFGADSVIPKEILQNAKGLAVLTVLKAGFLFSGRAGSGVLVARLEDGSWSGPTGIMTAGMGVGGQIGGELTDFVFILNNHAAVETFAQAGSITLGGNVSLAAGPIGRNAEAAGSASLKGVAAVFSYAKTKGLFAGVSLEGSVLIERRDANKTFYGQPVKARQILSGRVEPPPACDQLFRVLESRAFQGARYDDYNDFYDDIPDFSDTESSRSRNSRSRYDYDEDVSNDGEYYSSRSRNDGGGGGGSGGGSGSRRRAHTSSNGGGGGGASWEDDIYDRPVGRNRSNTAGSSSRRVRYDDDGVDDTDEITQHLGRTHFHSTYSDNPGRPAAPKPDYNGGSRGDRRGDVSNNNNISSSKRVAGRGSGQRYDDYDELYERDRERERRARDGERERETSRRQEANEKGDKAVALYTFEGEQGGDLSFRKGDVVTIVKKSDSTDDWWTGRIGGKEGIFPANYVELV